MRTQYLNSDIDDITLHLKRYRSKILDKTFLITGGSGFLGSYIVESLANFNNKFSANIKIISVDNNITSIKKNNKKKKDIIYLNKDVSKQFSIKQKVDYIVHAAGIASPVYYGKFPLETIDIAVYGTRNMLDLANYKKVKSFLFFSSSEIYGDPTPDSIPTKETYNGNVSPIGSRACYDESKRLGETLCMTYFGLFKTPIKIVRPFNIFGPGMSYKDHRVIPSLIHRALNNQDLLIHSDGSQTRTFCYVSDAIIAFFKVLLSNENGQIYNVGNSKNEISMNDLARLMGKVLNKNIRTKNISYPKNYPKDEPQRRCPDINKIKRKLNFSPKIDLGEGLARTITWCKQSWGFSLNKR